MGTPIAESSGSFGAHVMDSPQFVDRRQSPVRESGPTKVLAVLHCLVPVHIFAIVLPRPHESGGWINPIPTHLRLLRQASILCRGLSASNNGDNRYKNENTLCLPLHKAPRNQTTTLLCQRARLL